MSRGISPAELQAFERLGIPAESLDADEWAHALCGAIVERGRIDEDWLSSWFAAAMLTGYEEAMRIRDGEEASRRPS